LVITGPRLGTKTHSLGVSRAQTGGDIELIFWRQARRRLLVKVSAADLDG